MKSKVFNTEMVQAILKGDKTQFREPIKLDLGQLETDINDKDYLYLEDEYGDSHHLKEYSPYQVGDTIFVKETWLKADDGYHYKADIHVPSESEDLRIAYGYKYKPALYMPKEAARIFLKIKDIKVQKLQDVTEDEALKEGIEHHTLPYKCWEKPQEIYGNQFDDNAKNAYESLWNSKYEKKGYGWNENPWVWCIEFERV